MKVLIVNTSDLVGGASIAASRLMTALNEQGTEVEMLVLHKVTSTTSVTEIKGKWLKKLSFLWERFVIWINNGFSRKNLFKISIANTGFDITRLPAFQQADVIHLHWINQGMLSIADIHKIMTCGKPVVWTLHDMWECTAICHHAYTCTNFHTRCKECPFLRFPGENDLAAKVFKKKLPVFRQNDFQVVTVSRWLALQANSSALLKNKQTTIIPNTLSLEKFIIHNKQACRKEFSLPQEKYILLFGAARVDDPIKGLDILFKAIHHLIQQSIFAGEQLHLVLFGKIKNPMLLNSLPITYSYMGEIKEQEKLAGLYSAADVTISASLYETFGQTLIEAQACGCLPVSFNNSGQTDIIDHKKNGYLAEYLSIEDLAQGIKWVIEEGNKEISKEKIRENTIRKYSPEIVAALYKELYKNIIDRK